VDPSEEFLESVAPTAAPVDEGDAHVEQLQRVVKHTFGFDRLRPHQEEAMRASLDGRDALVVLPTGGGKSLCYQAPALVRSGLTVVVSPLIALMKDQLDSLRSNGVPAAMLTSAQDYDERRTVLRDLSERMLRILFVAPERLVMDGFLERLEEAGLAGIAVDEAHCISHWGHDFRPEYRQLGELRRGRDDLAIQAFTATATPQVQDDIIAQLGLQDPVRIVGDFDRPNLTYRIQPRSDLVGQAMSVVRRHPRGAGIIYCLRRKDTEKLARDLAREGVRCLPYHAGLEASERKRVQDAFQAEEIDVVVATIAFGMGIDRPDVRFVIHASLPKGVEQYSQETGRAGRDGLASECVLFYSGSDFHGWKNIMLRSAREAEAEGLPDAGADLDHMLTRLDHMWNFANGTICRHKTLVEYFGQAWSGETSCGACDVCMGELEAAADSVVIAQKILSCVVRCDQRYGAGHVTDVLRGADTARIRQAGHQDLSTYGLLKDQSKQDVRSFIDQLLAHGHLVTAGEYPTLRLTQSGLQVMRAEAPVTLFAPKRGPKSKRRGSRIASLASDGPAPDEGLFEALRKLRRQLAAERGVPPYILFNDRTLVQMAAYKPKNETDFLALKGVGAKKAADLGETFLAAIAEYERGDAAQANAEEPSAT